MESQEPVRTDDVELSRNHIPAAGELPASGEQHATALIQVPPKRSLAWRLRRSVSAGNIWYWSTRAYKAGWIPVAWALKLFVFFFYKALLPFQCNIESDIKLIHMGLGCAIHPNVTIGKRVWLYHHVTIAAEVTYGSPSRVIIEDDVVIGAHSIILGNTNGGIRIGKGSVIGAGAIVTRDVPPGCVVLPVSSRPVKMVKDMKAVSE